MLAGEQSGFRRCSAGTAGRLNTVVVHVLLISILLVSRSGISLVFNCNTHDDAC